MRSRRDAGNGFGAILAYADRAAAGDGAARDVLHDALLERYPQLYTALIRLAESRQGTALVPGLGRPAKIAIGCAFEGPRLILLDIDQLAHAEARLRMPRWVRESRRYRQGELARAFEVATASPQSPFMKHATDRFDRYVVTYVSRNTRPCSTDSPRRTRRDDIDESTTTETVTYRAPPPSSRQPGRPRSERFVFQTPAGADVFEYRMRAEGFQPRRTGAMLVTVRAPDHVTRSALNWVRAYARDARERPRRTR